MVCKIREKESDCMLPLTMANQGEEKTILKLGGKEEVRKQLETLGFVVEVLI